MDNEELGDDDADNVSGEVAERQARRLDAAHAMARRLLEGSQPVRSEDHD